MPPFASYNGVWLSLVERYVRDVEVASSNLVTPISSCFSSEKLYFPKEYAILLQITAPKFRSGK